MEKPTNQKAVPVAAHEDMPQHSSGLLIPTPRELMPRTSMQLQKKKAKEQALMVYNPKQSLMMVMVVMMFMLSVGVTTYVSLLAGEGIRNAAAPIIVLSEQEAVGPEELQYGEKVSFTEPNFFADIKEALLLSGGAFIEADLNNMTLNYYEGGENVFFTKILSKGEPGSLSETPAGMYQIEAKDELRRSVLSGAQHPWSMLFQGNFYIHGQPHYSEAAGNPEIQQDGGIRLSDQAAAELFGLVAEGTTVLVHETGVAEDSFVYEPTVPALTAQQYLVADVDTNAVLASSELQTVAPVASITKLMTALVAIEHFTVADSVVFKDGEVSQTAIPRLVDGDKITIYDLLRLMLTESSNEAADVVADQIGREEFIALMNKKAASLGLADTTFADPSGLSQYNTSTLADLLHLTQYIHNNRSFIFNLTTGSDVLQVLSDEDLKNLYNFNELEDDESFAGGKVGETLAAGQTSISLHKMVVKGSPRVLAIIILNSQDRDGDVLKLVEYVGTRFSAE